MTTKKAEKKKFVWDPEDVVTSKEESTDPLEHMKAPPKPVRSL